METPDRIMFRASDARSHEMPQKQDSRNHSQASVEKGRVRRWPRGRIEAGDGSRDFRNRRCPVVRGTRKRVNRHTTQTCCPWNKSKLVQITGSGTVATGVRRRATGCTERPAGEGVAVAGWTHTHVGESGTSWTRGSRSRPVGLFWVQAQRGGGDGQLAR